jgi:kinesin family protein C1
LAAAQAQQLERQAATLAALQASAVEADALRRQLHNQVQDLKGNIRVFCRVRPLLPHEEAAATAAAEKDAAEAAKVASTLKGAARRASVAFGGGALSGGAAAPGPTAAATLGMAVDVAGGLEPKKLKVDNKFDFSFDRVFAPGSSQGAVFEDVADLVTSVLDGYNACVLAYGQTGSGKTFTMEGGLNSGGSGSCEASGEAADDELGIIPRSVAKLFAAARQRQAAQGWVTDLQVSHLEVYNDEIRDLLAGAGEKLGGMGCVKHDLARGHTDVANLSSHAVADPPAALALLRAAAANRRVAATKLNARSSRSHAVFWLKVTSRHPASGAVRAGSLVLVDLAGSERLEASGAAGEQLKEALAINQSLSSLGNVVRALGHKGSKPTHVPFRDCTLTYLLQTCLGGAAKCLMLVNVSPAAASTTETLCSLRFAQKVNATDVGVAKKHGTAASSSSS